MSELDDVLSNPLLYRKVGCDTISTIPVEVEGGGRRRQRRRRGGGGEEEEEEGGGGGGGGGGVGRGGGRGGGGAGGLRLFNANQRPVSGPGRSFVPRL